MKTCEEESCWATFTPAKHNAKYCSKACNIKAHNARRARHRREKNGPLSDSASCQADACHNTFQQVRAGHKYCSPECLEKTRQKSRRAIGYDPLRFVPTNVVTSEMRRKMNETTAHKMPNEIGIVRSVGNLDLAPDLSSHDNSNVGEFDDSRGGNLTGEQELQIRVLEEAVSCAQGRGLKGNKKKLRDEAIRWLRGDDDCVELGPFNSAACFHAAGIDQQAAILSMGLPS